MQERPISAETLDQSRLPVIIVLDIRDLRPTACILAIRILIRVVTRASECAFWWGLDHSSQVEEEGMLAYKDDFAGWNGMFDCRGIVGLMWESDCCRVRVSDPGGPQ